MKLRTKIALALTVFLHALAATNLQAQVELGDIAGQWEGSGAISVATINSSGAVEFTATTRTAKTKSPWNKVVASLVSKDGGTITLSSYTHIGNAVRGPLAGTYNVATDSITWANKAVWKRKFDPAMAKMRQSEIQAQLDAANQRAAALESQLNQNKTSNSDSVSKLLAEMATLMAAQQASEAQRAEMAKKIESLQTKAEEKNVLPKDAPIVGVGATTPPPAPAVPTSGKTLRVRNNGGYVAVFYAKWVNKATFKAEEWNSGNLTAGFEASLEVPADAVNMELWAVGIGASSSFGNKEIFRTGDIDLGKKYIVTGTIESFGGTLSHYAE